MAETKFKQYDRALVRHYKWQVWVPAIFDKMVDDKEHFFIGKMSYHYPMSRVFDEELVGVATDN